MTNNTLASRRIVAVLLLVIPLSQIGLDVYTPALPKMAIEFAASNALVQNTVTAYMLGMTVSFLPVGLIADAVGRRRILLAGLALLVVASIACALVPNLPVLMALRFVQGIGASACLLLAATIAADCFRGAKLVSVLGLLGAAWGAAPVLAPAVGGFVLQVTSWRVVFGLFALLAVAVALLVAKLLPETLADDQRTPVDPRAALRVLGEALRHRIFLGFVVMFGLIGAAQMSFGVVGPFLYQVKLGFSPASYGVIALVVGTANLAGELACGGLAQRVTTRRLALGAWAVFMVGAATMAISAEAVGVNAWVITVGAGLALLGCGVLDPQTKGLALGVFSRNVGLISGLVNTCCYLIVSMAMALTAYLPEESQAPLGWFYVGVGVLFAALLMATVSKRRPARPTCPRARACSVTVDVNPEAGVNRAVVCDVP
jgi:DHA1 family bicyclomycin/chloramphenicol resistance-like MFS transporter